MNTKHLTLKEIALEIKEIITGGHNIDIEKYAQDLSDRGSLELHDVKDIYNYMFSIYNVEIDESSKRRIWLDCEDNFIINYIEIYKRNINGEIPKPIRDVLNDLESLLISRSATSISFRYYNTLSKNKKKRKYNTVKRVTKQKEIKEVKQEVKQETKREIFQEVELEDSKDLLGIVAEIIDNVEVAEVDVVSLFNNILTLSQKAVKSSGGREMKLLKSQLENEKEDNRLLRIEIKQIMKDLELLKGEVLKFNKMNGKDKLRNLQEFNNNVKYIVDDFGTVKIK